METAACPETLANKKQVGPLLKMGPEGCPETSVTKYQSALSNISEERSPQLAAA